ncbi:SDR family oxidoreductase [Proteus mirabilis]|uniref:SDR family oxidoreductase n=1 Tax=Proteus mirabilis TaxID=584 RepID=UPI001A2C34FF|nr:D-threitol dehydrogenase [Proteus mirabilis]MDM3613384.1 D-threitol dehydrogenase [Proteus mirabilis]HAT5575466.1 D-threitol dehydrogenase [Proteus mirabilis]
MATQIDFTLSNKVAVITGGAAGIGLSIAQMFIEKGAKVALLDRSEQVEQVAHRLNSAVGIWCDVSSEESVKQAVHSVIEELDRIDILVNCAGIVALAPAESLSLEDWNKTLSVNLTGTFLLCQQVGQHMLQRGQGKIINLASQAGIIALPEHIAYCASKAAIINMTKVMALEWGPKGLQINAISPTIVMTDLGKKAWEGEKGEQMKAQIPARRFAEPEEIAAAAVFLASAAADMINGHNLVIDGGYTIQ